MIHTAQPTTATVPATATATNDPGTDDILASLPVPVVRLLILFSGPLGWARRALEVVQWRAETQVASWLVVVGWWGVCLGGRAVWRYFLPLVLLLPFVPYPSNPSLTPAPTTLNPPLILSTQPYTTSANPATSQTLLRALADLHAINGLVPTFEARREWIEWVKTMERKRLLRALGVIWTAWILVNAVLGARATLAIIGTILLLVPSPFLANTSELLHRSLLIRRLSAFAFLFIFGSTGTETDAPLKTDERDALPAEPFSVRAWLRGKWTASKRPSFAFRARPVRPPLVTSASLTGSALDTTPPPSPPLKPTDPSLQPSAPLYFRFELQENQRWWMGLDWTSALLPQERAAWCDVYLNPTSPPQGFTLPSETTIYLPEPRKGDPAGRVRRTARWRWVDEEWIVVRKLAQGKIGAGISAATPVADRPSHASTSSIGGVVSPVIAPTASEEPKKGIAEQAFVKGLERLKARTMAGGVGLPSGLAGVVGAAGAKARPLSGDYTTSGSPGTSPEVGRRMSEDSKRKSSGASGDLVHTALNNATTMQANGIGLGILGDSASASAGAPMPMPSADLDAGTDMDGWSYGDNKWEGMGPKGGLGKYTRRRRWQRRAICTEEIEYIPGEKPAAPSTPSKEKSAFVENHEAGTTVDKDRLVVGVSVPTPSNSAHRSVSPISSPSPARHSRGPPLRLGSGNHHGHVEGYTVAPATAAPAESDVTVTPTVAADVLISGSSPATRGRHGSTDDGRDGALRQRLRNAMGSQGA
ncbi:hypothetical protein NliqN6_6065 [Naganishia liquefaciens]|uniref:Peroxin/Ferlin domain-containing protein n=1 Tax=Naganishia liquefaciens TaxID=104408 RepID=A0A8H3YHT0_9TREE|nr:hypothetical protein NliqN6_6065 [Naganishia liquefaciens]